MKSSDLELGDQVVPKRHLDNHLLGHVVGLGIDGYVIVKWIDTEFQEECGTRAVLAGKLDWAECEIPL